MFEAKLASNQEDIVELISHQEYIKYKAREGINISNLNNKFYFKSYQRSLQNFISIHSKIMRLIVKYETGAGKTNSALNSAITWIENMKALGIHECKIIVIGFSKKLFVRELLTRPELGFISEAEIDLIREKAELYKMDLLPHKEYKLFMAGFKRRLTNASMGGFFKFIGYKELANDLFGLGDSEDIDIEQLIKANKVNKHLVDMFENSFVIVDEFHKLYNSRSINVYGSALKYILDQYGDKIKVLMLSATPLTNSPREVADLLNIIAGSNYEANHFTKDDKLISGSLEKIKELFRGRVCYVRNENPELYPTKRFTGQPIDNIPYLKFNKCIISKEHENILRSLGPLQIDQLPIIDYILPGPNGYIYKSSEVAEVYGSDWGYANNHIVRSGDGYTHIKNIDLSVCSAKYMALINMLNDTPGKVLIFHPRIRSSGVIFISDMLREHGYIAHDDMVANNTICMICKVRKDEHKAEHNYVPARYVIIHGDIPKNKMEQLLDMYNAPENTYGHMCQICLGSEVIIESLNFKAIQDCFITSVLDSSGALIQLIGRCVRMGSHLGLTVTNRHVNIHILVSHYGNGSMLTPEEERYFYIMDRYKDIQKIDKAMHEAAIDSVMNYPLISKELADNINILYYKPDYDEPAKIEYAHFHKYYMDKEVAELMDAIKIIFTVYSKVWILEDLWDFMHMAGINYEFDIDKVTYDAFIIAVNNLINGLSISFTDMQPTFYIMRVPHCIVNIESNNSKFLMAVPCYTKQTIIGTDATVYNYVISIDAWYRLPAISMQNAIHISEYIKKDQPQMATIREAFLNESTNLNEIELIDALNEYDEDFHINMMQYCISYVFNILTNLDVPLLEYHHIVIRLLHAYTLLGYVIYASDMDSHADIYKKYLSDEEIGDAYDNMLISMSRTLSSEEIYSFAKFNSIIEESKRMPDSNIHELHVTKSKRINKVPADMLPVAYSMNVTSKYEYSYYHPEHNIWMKEYEPLYTIIGNENDIIVGYDVDVTGVLGKVFKLRKPITAVADKRLVSKGMTCGLYKKEQIKELAMKLDIKLDMSKIKNACKDIKKELIRREINSRRNKEFTKWFYFSFENNPIRH